MTNFAATSAFHEPTSCFLQIYVINISSEVKNGNLSNEKIDYLNKNYLFKLVRSILSKSITLISLKPERAKSFKISQPSPPAPKRI